MQLRYDQDRAELDRRVHEQQETEDEVAHLRERVQLAEDVAEEVRSLRMRNSSMLQSIKDLKVGLKARKALYQTELWVIDSQSGSYEMQIQEIQASLEGLAIKKTYATSDYQEDKAAEEVELKLLQEKIVNLF
jgi:CO dehydrogenase/acetyl-CoA synthase beta subunit